MLKSKGNVSYGRNMKGYYYLHTNGDLIWKSEYHSPEDFDSPFVRKWWTVNPSDRSCAWKIILEGLSCGASIDRVKRLAAHWNCTVQDLVEYMTRNLEPSLLERTGIVKYLDQVVDTDPDEWFDWLAKTPKGSVPDWSSMPRRTP